MHRRVRLAPSVVGVAILAFTTAVRADDETDARIDANETTAVAALEAIRAAQERFKAARVVDVDNDAIGEYGLLRELTGVRPPRWASDGSYCSSFGCPDPDIRLLDASFTNAVRGDPATFPYPTGEVARAGYVFQLVLPGAAGVGVPESWNKTLSWNLDSDFCETTWCCYAWPLAYGETGRRTFLINETGIIVATEDSRYSGSENRGPFHWLGAAFEPGDCPKCARITDAVAIDRTGRDGNYWRLVTPRTREPRVRGGGPLRRDDYPPSKVGHCELTIERSFTSSIETLSVYARGLRPWAAYSVLLDSPTGKSDAWIGPAATDSHGLFTYRYDSTRDRLPDGVSTLAEFSGGWITLTCRDCRFGGTDVRGHLPALDCDGTPEVTGIRPADNELAAVAALRAIADAQTRFQGSARADVDTDGIAEFGLLRELSGSVPVRTFADGTGVGTRLDPPLIPPEFGVFNAHSDVPRSGYLFHMILPGAQSTGLIEFSTGQLVSNVSADLAETTWCCYAWPARYGATGTHTYFVNQDGIVTETGAGMHWERYAKYRSWYGGRREVGMAAMAGAALPAGGPTTQISGPPALDQLGRDGHFWRTLPNRSADTRYTARGLLVAVGESGAEGRFSIELDNLRTGMDERFEIHASGLPPQADLCVAATSASGDVSADLGRVPTDTRGSTSLPNVRPEERLGNQPRPPLEVFSGGTLEVLLDGVVLLRGRIPRFATFAGPNEPETSFAARGSIALAPGPHLRLKLGRLEVRATADADGTREEMTLTVTTFDRLADRADVVAVAGDVETPLGTIRLEGDRGAGVLQFDTARGDAIPGGSLAALSGQRVEVRDSTGAVLLTGTFPSVE